VVVMIMMMMMMMMMAELVQKIDRQWTERSGFNSRHAKTDLDFRHQDRKAFDSFTQLSAANLIGDNAVQAKILPFICI
jgi:hypothetical protein